MAQRRRVSNTPYIYDNTARDLQIRRQMEEPRRQLSHETRKNREKARHMSIGYVTFLMGALIACAAFLVNYIQMQSELTTKITEVSRMESELNSLKLSNDEEYSRITSNINLEEIKRIAIGELGMTGLQRHIAESQHPAAALHPRMQRHPHFWNAHQIHCIYNGRCDHQKYQRRCSDRRLSLHAAADDLASNHRYLRCAGFCRRRRRNHRRRPRRSIGN